MARRAASTEGRLDSPLRKAAEGLGRGSDRPARLDLPADPRARAADGGDAHIAL